MEQTAAFVGDSIEIKGSLTSQGAGLAGREVVLLLDGVPYLNSQTGPDGSYQGQLRIPYNYVPSLTLQALYYPLDKDVGVYLSSKSPAVEIQVLFYTASLQLEIRGKSYPGLDSNLYGRFDYGDQPVPAVRDIQIYLDKKLVSEVSVGDNFEERIPLGPETPVGKHSLSVIALAQQRYALVISETTSNVVKAVLVISISPPRVAFMPFALNLKGHVSTEFGPLDGAVVEVALGDRRASAITSEDGTFTVKLETGMNLGLVGSQELSLEDYEKSLPQQAEPRQTLLTISVQS